MRRWTWLLLGGWLSAAALAAQAPVPPPAAPPQPAQVARLAPAQAKPAQAFTPDFSNRP